MPIRAPMHRPVGWKPREAKASGWQDDRLRGTSTERGYGAEWRKLRARVLGRDAGLCQPCLKAGRLTLAREVDHIISKAAGGTDEVENLQSICLACHRTKTARESRKGQLR